MGAQLCCEAANDHTTFKEYCFGLASESFKPYLNEIKA